MFICRYVSLKSKIFTNNVDQRRTVSAEMLQNGFIKFSGYALIYGNMLFMNQISKCGKILELFFYRFYFFMDAPKLVGGWEDSKGNT